MEKVVDLGHERKIKIKVDNMDNPSKREIVESFSVDGLECAHYSLTQDDKFYFQAEVDPDIQAANSLNNLSFVIDINHPLFFAFLHLLNEKNEIMLKDNDNDLKYLGITRDNDVITLKFVDKIRKEKMKDKYRIEYDSSLKYISNKESIEMNATKERLKAFFAESSDLLFEDSHQISFEEYTLRKTITERERLSS